MAHPLILVDGSAFLFRSYFSTISQNLTNDSGFPTGAMFGVVNANIQLVVKNATIQEMDGKTERQKKVEELKAKAGALASA